MRQLFAPGADAIFRFFLLCALVGVVAFFVIAAGFSNSDYATQVGVAPAQPVEFSHKHHSGELGLDCRYCHTSVETDISAGMPPTYTCMTCHSQIWTGAPMLAPVRDSLAQNIPIEWNRVNQLPAYVYFNHSIHTAKGIGCSSCHGTVTDMQMTYRAHAFDMQFCLNCHRAPEKFVRPAAEIWNMNWVPPADQDRIGKELVQRYHIHEDGRLTDCSICHR
jgi:Cytochrome c7 and related cytochrome c/Class III cytochrome C family